MLRRTEVKDPPRDYKSPKAQPNMTSLERRIAAMRKIELFQPSTNFILARKETRSRQRKLHKQAMTETSEEMELGRSVLTNLVLKTVVRESSAARLETLGSYDTLPLSQNSNQRPSKQSSAMNSQTTLKLKEASRNPHMLLVQSRATHSELQRDSTSTSEQTGPSGLAESSLFSLATLANKSKSRPKSRNREA